MALSPKTRNAYQQLFLEAADADKDVGLAGLRLIREYQSLVKLLDKVEAEVYRLTTVVKELEAERQHLQTAMSRGVTW